MWYEVRGRNQTFLKGSKNCIHQRLISFLTLTSHRVQKRAQTFGNWIFSCPNVKGFCRKEKGFTSFCVQHFIDSLPNNSTGRFLPRNLATPHGSAISPLANGICEAFERVGNRNNIRPGCRNHSAGFRLRKSDKQGNRTKGLVPTRTT